MLKSEFIEYAGYEPTHDDYEIIEKVYYEHTENKQVFCSEWAKLAHEMPNLHNAIIHALSIVSDENNVNYNKYMYEWKRANELNECLADEISKRIAAQEKLKAIENILK